MSRNNRMYRTGNQERREYYQMLRDAGLSVAWARRLRDWHGSYIRRFLKEWYNGVR